MMGIGLAIVISIGIPFSLFGVSIYTKRLVPFLLGVLAFTVSQVLFRLPLLEYLNSRSTAYALWRVLHPAGYAVMLGATAALAEEGARFLLMRFLMKRKDWRAGMMFGAGHGGLEALLLVGIPAVGVFFSPILSMHGELYTVAGLERLFAMCLHIGLSILVLQSVTTRRWRYFVYALLVHTLIDTAVGLLPLLIPAEFQLVLTESLIGLAGFGLLGYAFWVKWREKR